jgi:DNA excision repair protein ERCC-3
MPPKRKALGESSGRALKRPSKTSTPNVGTPRSMGSTDDFSDGSNFSDDDVESGTPRETQDHSIKDLTKKFSIEAYRGKRKQTQRLDPIFRERDYSWLDLKPDHSNRPLWIDGRGMILLESFSPVAAQAQDFLTTIAEPESRPTYVHEYKLTMHSLYAAVSVGLQPRDIIHTLEKFSKTPVPQDIQDFIIKGTASYGKVKLVLKHNRYFVESGDPQMLQVLLKDPVIGPLRVEGQGIIQESAPQMGAMVIPGTKDAAGFKQHSGQGNGSKPQEEGEKPPEDDIFATLRDEDDDDDQGQVHSFEISSSAKEEVQKRCQDLGYPTLEEYDFKNDTDNPDLLIDLQPKTQIRSYQEKSLSKMFGNGRAKSGIIVLPCGAGKTLVGITAACTIRKGIIILCTSSMSVVQWKAEFLKWSNIQREDIATFTSDNKEPFTRSTGIIISTYSMVTQNRNRSYDSQKMMNFMTTREWGLMILDEVHVVPASIFRKVTSAIGTHSKLGLTATLLREDDKIRDLNFLIGPKLYEANWMELAEQGHIAKVQCAEVWCPMDPTFYKEYLDTSHRKRTLLYIMNPNKFQACQYLIDYHEKRGDKTIVFSDNVYALEQYAKTLKKVYIYGGTPQAERIRILQNFQFNENINTLFLSKIGDTSLDLPEATCLIQISSHYGSRRQEAQRLGRILRAKRRNDEGFNAFFYSLVSKDTTEVAYSAKRQGFLCDQGYAFKTITNLQGMLTIPDLKFRTRQDKQELLQQVMLQNETAGDQEQVDDLFDDRRTMPKKKSGVRRTAGTLGDLSGEQAIYYEQGRSRNQELKREQKKVGKSDLFRKFEREREKRKKERRKLLDE